MSLFDMTYSGQNQNKTKQNSHYGDIEATKEKNWIDYSCWDCYDRKREDSSSEEVNYKISFRVKYL